MKFGVDIEFVDPAFGDESQNSEKHECSENNAKCHKRGY
jgi:hypothetical protein